MPYESDNADNRLEERCRRANAINRKKKVKKTFRAGVIAVLAVAVAGTVAGYEACGYFQKKETTIRTTDTKYETFDSVSMLRLRYPTQADDYKEIGDDVKSPYAVLIDADACKVIAGKQYDQQMYPASMTKVMTLLTVADNLTDLDQTYQFSREMLQHLILVEDASVAGFFSDEVVPAYDLLYGMILPSGADAATALAELTAGSEDAFADLMNQECQKLGLKHTHFTNCVGLHDPQLYSTPEDMAYIFQYAMHNPICAKVLSTQTYTTSSSNKHASGITLNSGAFSKFNDSILNGCTLIGGKTGFTDEAQNCLVTMIEKNGRHYVIVTGGLTDKAGTGVEHCTIMDNYAP